MIELDDVAWLLAAAVIAVPLFRRLQLSSVLGYVAAGVVLGPWALGAVTDVDRIQHISEFGVVLLLFVIGLELQPSRLWALRRTVFGLGALQVVSVSVVVAGIALAFGLDLRAALVVGFALSLASTPLVLQILAERGQLTTQPGRAAFGILLFQDLAALPALAALPLLATATAAEPDAHAGVEILKIAVVLIGLIVGGRLLLRPLLRVVAKTKVTEAFTAAALLIVVGTSLVADAAGLSMALGAFIAGVMLADSEFRHELDADIQPFKGLFLGLFFISVGLSANLGLIASQPLLVLVLTLALLVTKAAVQSGLGLALRQPRQTAFGLGITLATGGEFAFVLFGIAARERILPAAVADLLVLVVTLSMVLGPLLLSAYAKFVHARLDPQSASRPFDRIDAREPRVIIAGFGRVGQIVGRVLRARRIRFTALDANQTHIDFIRRFGNEIYYGDASRLELLRAADAAHADLLVLAIDDVEASVRTAEMVRRHFPDLPIVARARNRQHAFRLLDLGVSEVFRETLGTSLDMATATLVALGDQPVDARRRVAQFREHDAATLLRQHAIKDDESKLIASARESATQLEQLFEADVPKEADRT
jgi:glutathione-regulated potassium-efflux system ancillary protein KefC/glutathione-regulated potassium-efflux system protein KefB